MAESTIEVKETVQAGPQDRVDKIRRVVEVAMAAELHAFVLLAAGVGLVLCGHKDEGSLVLGGALGIFRGKSS